MREAYLFYAILYDKKDVSFKIYTECISTNDIINKDKTMMWYPLSLNQFLENFDV